ncbi:MAG: beta-N-acetylhexosaminidase, partial [Rhabdochlamydiaceae bacterium]
MSLEEKVGQVLMVHFNGEQVNEDAKALVQKINVGGIIYYNWANGLNSPSQVLSLSSGLQKLTEQNRVAIPLFITADQEGGLVARLNKGFTIFPGNRALGMTGDHELAEQCAYAIGQELRTVGVNLNLSPVVDVNNNPRNPVIGIRSFGESTEIVIPFARSAIEGYHKAGIMTSLKHFPGHGDVEIDSHEDLPVIKKTKQQLQKVELLPFAELASQADTVVTAHVIVPSIDSVNCATLSKNVLDILRKEIGFEGAIIADSLVMEGLLKNCSSVDDAAIRALNAGCDILTLGGKQLIGNHANLELKVADVERIHQALVIAVKKGVITEERLNEAVQRVLNLKNKYNLLASSDKQLASSLNTPAHQQLAKKIASLALKSIENKSIPYGNFHQNKLAVFAPVIAKENIQQTSLLKLGKEMYP